MDTLGNAAADLKVIKLHFFKTHDQNVQIIQMGIFCPLPAEPMGNPIGEKQLFI